MKRYKAIISLFCLLVLINQPLLSKSLETGIGLGMTALSLDGISVHGGTREVFIGGEYLGSYAWNDAIVGIRIGEIKWNERSMDNYLYSINITSSNPRNLYFAIYIDGSLDTSSDILFGLTPYVGCNLGFFSGNVLDTIFFSVMGGFQYEIKPVIISFSIDLSFNAYDILKISRSNSTGASSIVKIRLPFQ